MHWSNRSTRKFAFLNKRVAAHIVASNKRALLNDCCWPNAGTAVIEIVPTLLTVKLLVRMLGMEQAVPEGRPALLSSAEAGQLSPK